MSEPSGLAENKFVNNLCLFGSKYASNGVRLVPIIDSGKSEIDIVDYTAAVPAFSVVLQDAYMQTVADDSESTVQASVSPHVENVCDGLVRGETIVRLAHGVATVTSLDG